MTLVFTPGYPVILMLRSYAFTGRRRLVLAALSISFFSVVSYVVWVMSMELSCSSPGSYFLIFINSRSGTSDCFVYHQRTIWLLRHLESTWLLWRC
jgi:hypothetical protein